MDGVSRKQIEQAVFLAIDEINEELPEAGRIERTSDAKLFGREGVLDSLGLVNLIVAVEQAVEDELEITITLADEKAISQKNSPFRSVESLVDYIESLISPDEPGE